MKNTDTDTVQDGVRFLLGNFGDIDEACVKLLQCHAATARFSRTDVAGSFAS